MDEIINILNQLSKWIKNFDWQKLLALQMKAPFIPNLSADNYDEQHANFERSLNESEQ